MPESTVVRLVHRDSLLTYLLIHSVEQGPS